MSEQSISSQIEALKKVLPNAKNKYAVKNKIKQLETKLASIKNHNWLAQ